MEKSCISNKKLDQEKMKNLSSKKEMFFLNFILVILYTWLIVIVTNELNKPQPVINKDAEIRDLKFQILKTNNLLLDSNLHRNCIKFGI